MQPQLQCRKPSMEIKLNNNSALFLATCLFLRQVMRRNSERAALVHEKSSAHPSLNKPLRGRNIHSWQSFSKQQSCFPILRWLPIQHRVKRDYHNTPSFRHALCDGETLLVGTAGVLLQYRESPYRALRAQSMFHNERPVS